MGATTDPDFICMLSMHSERSGPARTTQLSRAIISHATQMSRVINSHVMQMPRAIKPHTTEVTCG